MSDRRFVDPRAGGVVAVCDRLAIVWVHGPDAVGFLDGLLSQNVGALQRGATARSLLLAPNGKLRAVLFVLREVDRVGLVCDSVGAESVVADLNRFKIRVDAHIEPESRSLYEVWGAADDYLDPPPPGRWREDAARIVFAMPFARSEMPRIVVVGQTPPVPIVSRSELDPIRIEIGEPEMGIDFNEKTIPQEGVEVREYVDFTKGCYLGQELVARIDSRGHVNRRLAGLQIRGGEPPAPGTALLWKGRDVGTVTSAAWSPRSDCVVALAMLRVEVEPGELVGAGDKSAQVVSLPMP